MADRLTIPVLPGWEGDTSRPVRVDGRTVGWVLGRYWDWEARLWPVADQRPEHYHTCELVARRLLRDLRTELRRRLAEDGPWWVSIDPGVMSGTPCIAGTRVPAHQVSELAEDGLTAEQVAAIYPSVRPAGVRAAVAYASREGGASP